MNAKPLNGTLIESSGFEQRSATATPVTRADHYQLGDLWALVPPPDSPDWLHGFIVDAMKHATGRLFKPGEQVLITRLDAGKQHVIRIRQIEMANVDDMTGEQLAALGKASVTDLHAELPGAARVWLMYFIHETAQDAN